jgi:predicted dehydrogenase
MAAPLKVATVGAGFFAAFHHDSWARHPDVEFVAIIDENLARAQAAATRYGCQASDDLEGLLISQQIDLLDIATPPNTATGQLLVVHENFRFQPWYREIKRLLDQGQFGRLHNIAFRLRPGDGQGPDAYLSRQPYFQKMNRFLIHETAIHFIDTFRFLLGEIETVYADLKQFNPVIAGEDAGYVIFGFAGGAGGIFDGNRLNDHSADNPRLTMGEMWLEGSTGVMRLDGDGRLFWKAHGRAETEHVYVWENVGFGGDCVYQLQDHVIRHLRDASPIENSAANYLRNLEIEEAIYRSADENRQIRL